MFLTFFREASFCQLYCHVCRGGQANFFCNSENCKSASSWAQSAIANPQIFRCASPQIANPQIFIINLQIAKSQVSTKFECITLYQNSPKSRLFYYDFCIYALHVYNGTVHPGIYSLHSLTYTVLSCLNNPPQLPSADAQTDADN